MGKKLTTGGLHVVISIGLPLLSLPLKWPLGTNPIFFPTVYFSWSFPGFPQQWSLTKLYVATSEETIPAILPMEVNQKYHPRISQQLPGFPILTVPWCITGWEWAPAGVGAHRRPLKGWAPKKGHIFSRNPKTFVAPWFLTAWSEDP